MVRRSYRWKRVHLVALTSAVVLFMTWTASPANEGILDTVGETVSPSLDRWEIPPLMRVKVDAESSTGTTVDLTRDPEGRALPNFATYRLEASGVYRWDRRFANALADAECTREDVALGGENWLTNRFQLLGFRQTGVTADGRRRHDPVGNSDPYDLHVDGSPVDWRPLDRDPSGCNLGNHTYEFIYTPKPDRTLNLRVREVFPFFKLSRGVLEVKIFPGPERESGPDDRLVETVIVNPRDSAGALTATALVGGQHYRFVAKGTYEIFRSPGVRADVECSVTFQDQTWKAHRYDDQLLPSRMLFDNLDLFVDGTEKEWLPLLDTTGKGCNSWNHAYKLPFAPTRTGRVHFRLRAAPHPLNSGLITVDVFQEDANVVSGVGNTFSPQQPTTAFVTEVNVPVRDPRGDSTDVDLIAGRFYRVVAGGTYPWEPGNPNSVADSECLTSGIPGLNVWSPNHAVVAAARLKPSAKDASGDPFDLYVDGRAVDWEPLNPDAAGCNSTNHTYELPSFSPQATKRVNFAVFDPFFTGRGPAATLHVDIFEAAQPPSTNGDALIGIVIVNPKSPQGSGLPVPLTAGNTYRYVAEGVYMVRTSASADAECSQTPTDPNWVPNRFGEVLGFDNLDLLINGQEVTWVPLLDTTGKGCNTKDHAYKFEERLLRDKFVNFRLRAVYHQLNEGLLRVRVFQVHALHA